MQYLNHSSLAVIEYLENKKLRYLKEPYLELDKVLTTRSKAYLKKQTKKLKPKEFVELLISYFNDKGIHYTLKELKKSVKEPNKAINKRQKDYIERQKAQNKKKLQVFISEYDYKLLQKMKEQRGKTFAQIVSKAIQTQSRYWLR
ncbi:MAG TPA: hypothetical protein ENM99_06350 [Desulfurella acetivorans]|uniref:Uncharacterized protein n=1 Tax=Desulfurella acetivorans TaxID=33002 RepID=A0A7C6EC96_DESAE|nr:hypothetical protein [Desulfurella acetivorans]